MNQLVELCYWTINISLIASLVSILVIVYRRLSRYNRNVNSIIWTVLAIRLVLPASYTTPFSIVKVFQLIGLNVNSISGAQPFYYINVLNQAEQYNPIVIKSDTILLQFQLMAIIWLLGFSVIMFSYIFTSLKINSLKKKSKLIMKIDEIKIYENIAIKSPFLFGIFKPVIFMTINIKKKYESYVVLHEIAHFKRKDNLKRIVGLMICSIHWFNPFVWMCYRMFLTDLEIETDHLVIKWIGEEKRTDYLTTLVQMSHKMQYSHISHFSSDSLSYRIKSQLEYNLSKKRTLLICGVIFLLTYYILLANI